MATASQGTALITGASSGIGYELAHVFAQHGYHLILVARTEQKLFGLAQTLTRQCGIASTVIPADLAQPSAPEAIAARVRQEGLTVDVLVNNAGFGMHGDFAGADVAEQLRMIQVNVTALTQLTALFLPEMKRRQAGKILNVASTAAFQPGPFMAVYYAGKAYVLSFSEALANELAGSGVTVTALCPGPTTTEFQRRAGIESTRLTRRVMDAKAVAVAGYQGLMRGKALVIPGIENQILAHLVRWLPRGVVIRAVRKMQETRRRRPARPGREDA